MFLKQHTKPEPAEQYFPGKPLGKIPFLTLSNDPCDCGRRAASSPAAADPAKTRRAKEDAPGSLLALGWVRRQRARSSLVSHKGLSKLWCRGQRRSHFQKNSHILLLKLISCAKRGPSLESPRLKPVPGQPRGVTPNTAPRNKGQTQAFGLLPISPDDVSGCRSLEIPFATASRCFKLPGAGEPACCSLPARSRSPCPWERNGVGAPPRTRGPWGAGAGSAACRQHPASGKGGLQRPSGRARGELLCCPLLSPRRHASSGLRQQECTL